MENEAKTSLPKVILHTAVSLDGRIDWFSPDVGLFYELAGRWKEDATLAGSETMLRAKEEMPGEAEGDAALPESGGKDGRPLLVVPDSRGRIQNWDDWRKQPYWRDVLVLCSQSTPRTYLDKLKNSNTRYLVLGKTKVDFRKAFKILHEKHNVRTIRVDSGGTLNGVLLREGLVSEVSLLVHPCLVGGKSQRSFFRADDLMSSEGVIRLELIHEEKLKGAVLWLVYRVIT